MLAIAFFTDTAMLPGLHVTLLSVLESLVTHTDAKIFVFADRVTAAEKQRIRATHSLCPQETELAIVDFTPRAPPGANALHGNFTAYGRIYLATLLPALERCIYLDCDLVVNRCVGELFERLDGKHTLCAGGIVERAHALDHVLFRQAGLDMTGLSFNSGVMALDLRLWRRKDRDQACAEVAQKYRGMFRSADQAMLNVVFHDDFVALGDEVNTPLYSFSPPLVAMEQRIYHFVGAPKPWDPLGRYLHRNHRLWWTVYERTAIGAQSPRRYASIKRSARTSRSSLSAATRRCLEQLGQSRLKSWLGKCFGHAQHASSSLGEKLGWQWLIKRRH